MVTDHVSDLLTRVRNAGKARLSRVDVQHTKLSKAVAEILVKEGYLKNLKEYTEDNKNYLRLYLKFENNDLKKPVIQGLRRVSRPGLRRYVQSTALPKVMSGFGVAILSTSKGVMTGMEARKAGVGGEHLCSVW